MRDLLEHVNEALDLDAEVEVVEEAEHIRGVLHGDDLGLFIGRHGQTIDAVQHLAFKVAAHGQLAGAAGGGRRRGLPRAPPRRRWSARPTRPPRTRSARRARSRWTR